MHRTAAIACALAACVATVAPADGDGSKPVAPPPDAPAPKAPADADAPAKAPPAPPGAGARARAGAMRPGFAAQRRDMELWAQTFEELGTDLTPEVLEQARAARMEFESRLKAWRTEHADALRSLEERMRQGGAAKQPPTPESMQEMRELMATAPRFDELMQRVLGMLGPDDQRRFKARYEELRAASERRLAAGAKAPNGEGPNGSAPKFGPKAPEKAGDGRRAEPEDAPDEPNRKGDGKPSGR